LTFSLFIKSFSLADWRWIRWSPSDRRRGSLVAEFCLRGLLLHPMLALRKPALIQEGSAADKTSNSMFTQGKIILKQLFNTKSRGLLCQGKTGIRSLKRETIL
jgi:hypothetical protein